ncbi:unnamed protein product [Dibothriocephalus latus]|uniref:Uncharacterized protein n=1 Tax=Dibothriocephalus latus TaxID=60516 RepID=A0A3P7LVN2_DIBLA|nr:unnamed protein product [Dibothriocephalus latus]
MDAEASTSGISCGTLPGRGRGLFRTPKVKRSASLFSCFPTKKPIRQLRQDDLLSRVRENSDRRCFTLPPMPTRTSTLLTTTNATARDTPDSFILPARYPTLTAGERFPSPTSRPYHSKLLAFFRGRQAEANQSFLRAARSGNIGKITEYLNANVDLNAVNSVSRNTLLVVFQQAC